MSLLVPIARDPRHGIDRLTLYLPPEGSGVTPFNDGAWSGIALDIPSPCFV
ncbi:hypothetical protein BHE74_00046721 [Ensete ventricosum]|nr:hypothetical protein BHE74_00046721 [Ensete ventricosum]